MNPDHLRDSSFDRLALEELGFEGFVPLLGLDTRLVPRDPGVYCVLRQESEPPQFVDASPAGWFKGKDPSVGLDRLEANWVPGATVVYIGKASLRRSGVSALRKRLDEYRRHGSGEPVGHWGGRFIWQLADAQDLLICWRPSGDADAEDIESEMLKQFAEHHGALPFANLKKGRFHGAA